MRIFFTKVTGCIKLLATSTAQKMKFCNKDFFNKCD